MHQQGDFLSMQGLDFEGWTEKLRPVAGRYSTEPGHVRALTGSVKIRSICSFEVTDLRLNAIRIERTQRDARLDDKDHYCAVFQIAGRSTLVQNDQDVELTAGDVGLNDAARAGTYFLDTGHLLCLKLRRRSLVSHLGFEPRGGSHVNHGTLAGRLIFQLVLDALEDQATMSTSADAYMQLAVYDLLGALFSPSDSLPVSLHREKLFRRVCAIIRDRLFDSELGPSQVAAEAGISLRYLQKLFTERGSTCTHFIHSHRLDHAARLLHRRASLDMGQPLSEIAYACGYSDYNQFLRKFRRRFGHSPTHLATEPHQLGRLTKA